MKYFATTRSLNAVFAWLGIIWGSTNVPAQTYLITDLGTLGGTAATAAAINNNHEIAGTAATSAGGVHGFLISGGAMQDIGSLGGASFATALNSRGEVAGYSNFELTSRSNHPVFFRAGVLTDPGLPLEMRSGAATGLNDAGQLVGQLLSGPRRQTVVHAFLWQAGAFNDLGTLGGISATANDINNLGEIVGAAQNASGEQRAFLWQTGVMTDLGTLPGGFSSTARAINDAGQIAGTSGTANFGPSHAFLLDHGIMTDLGVIPGFTSSTANAINKDGVVVGSSTLGRYGNTVHAFVTRSGVITDLNRLIPGDAGNWVLISAAGINDSGEIVGTGTHDGAQRAFLLVPTTEVTVPAAPIMTAVSSGDGFVTLSWQGSVGATSYNVKRGTSSSGPFATIATVVSASPFTDESVVNCTLYFYTVSAVNSAGESPNSNLAAGQPQGVPPAPSNLTAKPNTSPNLFLGSAIDLVWQNNTTCAKFVEIEQSTDGINFHTLATVGAFPPPDTGGVVDTASSGSLSASTTAFQGTYTDGFLDSGTRYFYRVRAQSSGGESEFSNVASAVAP